MRYFAFAQTYSLMCLMIQFDVTIKLNENNAVCMERQSKGRFTLEMLLWRNP